MTRVVGHLGDGFLHWAELIHRPLLDKRCSFARSVSGPRLTLNATCFYLLSDLLRFHDARTTEECRPSFLCEQPPRHMPLRYTVHVVSSDKMQHAPAKSLLWHYYGCSHPYEMSQVSCLKRYLAIHLQILLRYCVRPLNV